MDASEGDDYARLVGADIERREDPALLTGRAEYTDDLTVPRMAHLAILRSRYGHARIEGIETDAAERYDGVFGVFTATDIAASDTPGELPITSSLVDPAIARHPLLADVGGRVRYQGQPIVAVVAEDRYTAADAIDAVRVDYERLPAVTDPIAAVEPDAPTIHDGAPDNVAVDWEIGDRGAVTDAFDEAAHVTEVDLDNNRLLPSALEPRAALARYDAADGRLTVDMTTQKPHEHRGKLSTTLGIPEQKIRVRTPKVGGGFGHKGHHHPGEALASWCAMQLDRPVKWQSTRSENYLAGAHAREHVTTARLALDDDGAFLALEVDTHAGLGGYALGSSPKIPTAIYGNLLSGQYAIPAIHGRVRAVFTNTAPVHSYRGAGRPEAIYVVERLVDAAARELGVDPVELRRRNQIPPDAFPYETAVGAVYDSGEYETALDTALDAVGYDALRERQERLRDDDSYLGIGIGCFVESTGGGPFESGVVRVHPSGGVSVYSGSHSHGQGHETTFAQIVADELGVRYDDIEVIQGDTERIPMGTGTTGSRSTVMGGTAVAQSAGRVREKAHRIAAHHLEADPDDVVFDRGEFSVAGAPDRSIHIADVAAAAYDGPLPEGLEPGLEATTFFRPEDNAYSFGTHVAVVEVDPEVGEFVIERYVAVDDCGNQINPRLVEGQVHGGVAQGVGQAMYEDTVYDDEGNLLTGTLQDYALPKAFHVPEMETDSTVTPSPRNPLGAKGIGEAGTIAAPPTIVNAVIDALAPLGVDAIDMPLTEAEVWRAVNDGSGE